MLYAVKTAKTWCQDIRPHNSNINFRKAFTLDRPMILTPKTVVQSISFLKKILPEEENDLQGWHGLREFAVEYLYRVIFKVNQKPYLGRNRENKLYKFVRNTMCACKWK